MYDEQTASQKWCPMVRLGEGNSTDNRSSSAGFIRNDEPGAGIKWNCCIASECMMWRWVKVDDCVGDEEHQVSFQRMTELGYCGLGGKP